MWFGGVDVERQYLFVPAVLHRHRGGFGVRVDRVRAPGSVLRARVAPQTQDGHRVRRDAAP